MGTTGNAGSRTRIRILIIMAVAAAAVLFARFKDGRDAAADASPAAARETAVEAPAEAADAATAVEALRPALIDLGADKCVPCKMMMPVLDGLREDLDGRLDVVFIDVWKDREAGKRYGVKMIPTQIFRDPDGAELFRHEGFISREDILAKWSELGYEFTVAAKTER